MGMSHPSFGYTEVLRTSDMVRRMMMPGKINRSRATENQALVPQCL